MKIKICSSCGTENSPANLECRECMADISGIRPVEKIEKPEPDTAEDASVTLSDARNAVGRDRLVLVSISAARKGDILPINDGDVLGREHAGKDLFAACSTISRRHAKISRSNEEWMIEDVGSTNGTYVNGRELQSGQKYPLKAHDILALSKSCEFLVES
jgi:pSer/pThr/pTyr-binding forkhead associated (FHA) protein/ribosomal protein L40E